MADTRLSTHFMLSEFACKCGKWPTCTTARPTPDLIKALEKLRAVCYQDGLRIVSGVRCAAHNATVGGAKESQHMRGTAADIPPKVDWKKLRSLGLFSGIGYMAASGLVVHVDVRPGSRTSPTTWTY